MTPASLVRPTIGRFLVIACQGALIAVLVAQLVWELTTVKEGYVGFAIPFLLGPALLIAVATMAWWLGVSSPLVVVDLLIGAWSITGLLHWLDVAGFEGEDQTMVAPIALLVGLGFAGGLLVWFNRRGSHPARPRLRRSVDHVTEREEGELDELHFTSSPAIGDLHRAAASTMRRSAVGLTFGTMITADGVAGVAMGDLLSLVFVALGLSTLTGLFAIPFISLAIRRRRDLMLATLNISADGSGISITSPLHTTTLEASET